MSLIEVECGFIPLLDAAPLIIAREMGFAEDEGVDLILRRERTWSAIRDKLASGQFSAAHMLAPAAIAMSLGLGGLASRVDVPLLLSVNGDVIGVSRSLAARLRDGGPPLDLNDAHMAGRRLREAAPGPLTIGAPFPFSMHVELLTYWLASIGMPPAQWSIRTVPPPQIADAVASGEIDMFCVGEPWGSQSVDAGAAEILLAGAAIWRFAPEKAMALRSDFVKADPALLGRLMRAVWRASKWLGVPGNRATAAEFLAWPHYVGVPAEVADRGLSGCLTVAPEGYQATVAGFMEFHDAAATFPWRSQAKWIATRLAERYGLDPAAARETAAKVFRPDLYREHLGPAGADLPGASEKVEGALKARMPVASSTGHTYLGPDRFFDDVIFDFST